MKGEKIDQYDLVLGLMEAKRGTSFTSSSLLSLPRESFAGRKTPRTLIVIGPEGGFSPEESQTLLELKNGRALHLPTPILRTQTALIASVGYILGHFH
jgi:RsmE family RNA methyltransferase